MSVKKKSAMTSRRGFLKGAATAGAAAAVSAVVTNTANADRVAAGAVAKQEEAGKGYHVTPHILDYYEKARF